jgi:hypothetical protein
MTTGAVVRFVTDFTKPWDIRRARCLGRLVYGLMRGGRLGVAEIGRHLPSKTTDKHNIKAVDRFLSNEKVDLSALWVQLLALASHASGRLHVLLDWSDLHHGDFELLQAAVSYGGRALPVAWTVSRKGHYGRSRNVFENNFCRILKALTPSGVELVIVADRGFARASFMRALQKAGIKFVIRVRRDVHLIHGRGRGPLAQRTLARGQTRDFVDALYGENARFEGRCVMTFGTSAKAPWYLLTNLHEVSGWTASKVIGIYAKRMRIEEGFRDHKSYRFGFQLRSVKLSRIDRYERLLAVAAVALLLLILLGGYIEDRGLDHNFRANTEMRRTHSLFTLGLAFLPRIGLRRPPTSLLPWLLNLAT